MQIRSSDPIAAAVMALGLFAAAPATAAVPDPETREGELACLGLMNLGFGGALSKATPNPQAVTAMSMAVGFYMGRMSKIDPTATLQDAKGQIDKLSAAEKNTYASTCMKRASEKLTASGRAAGSRP